MKTLLQIFSQSVTEGPGTSSASNHLIEILIMLIGAFLLGFILKYFLDRSKLSQLNDLKQENWSLREMLQEQVQQPIANSSQDEIALKEKITLLERSNDLLKRDIERCTNDRSRLEVQLKEEQRKIKPKAEEKIEFKNVNPTTTSNSDLLRKIEGIGPKIESLLHESGYKTFRDLSLANVEDLKQILAEANPAYKVHDPSTWPEQAILASEDRWEELASWQSDLKGGKRV